MEIIRMKNIKDIDTKYIFENIRFLYTFLVPRRYYYVYYFIIINRYYLKIQRSNFADSVLNILHRVKSQSNQNTHESNALPLDVPLFFHYHSIIPSDRPKLLDYFLFNPSYPRKASLSTSPAFFHHLQLPQTPEERTGVALIRTI